ncbi:type VI secretion system baseplate subunit TssE [Sulfuriferula thiophila]|uniref:type VI secretion system baseplate subunit TssE n=1 Tax=Sulfuriferula thiophila TaxID=1781211 RepID=UPI000F60F9FF|nr:type VI secretion system baseplate subunit TssE [Sulfuriferula thiophila]
MKGYAPGLFDKLMAGSMGQSINVVTSLSLEEMKDVVARDLESLLNTRSVISEEMLKRYPECSKSIVTYGLNDFAGMSLASADDRHYICRSLEQTIARHEPRLRNVRASLELEDGSTNRLNFAIAALLVLEMAQEPVNFDAVLQASSLQYSITKARRSARA